MTKLADASTNFLPLSQHLAIKTRDLDELKHFINAGLLEERTLDYIGRRRSLDAQLSHFSLKNLQFIGVQLGSNIAAMSAPLEVTQLLIPVRGRLIDSSCNRRDMVVSPGSAVVHNSNEPVNINWQKNTSCLSVRIPDACLKQVFYSHYGDVLPERFCVQPMLDLTQGPGQSLANIIYGIIKEIESESALLENPRTVQLWEELLLTALFRIQLEHVQNCTPGVGSHTPVYYYVKRAAEFIRENLDQQISTDDLTVVAGVSQRTLQIGFQKFFGTGPISYLRQERLKMVNAELNAAGPSDGNVGDIAAKWGFHHASHFSAQYRKMFGELPSTTLSIGRRGSVGRTKF